ncbi:MAG TPA: MBL fold metallo-hydrolase [Cellvibrio sp.]|nr:MBL fold metallo-hydrolase [Cellvibrio sp.]
MPMFSLKKFSLVAALTSAALIASLGSQVVAAAAPMAKTSAPGYFRIMLGSFEVTAINDGTVELPVDKLLNNPEPKTQAALADAFLKAPLETSVNAYLINTGEKLILVDAGAGVLFGPTLGKFIANLRASGYEPEQIDDIYITHLHSDHIGGLASNNTLAFPNAVVHLDKKEADFWLSKANLDKAPEDSKAFYTNAVAMLTPYKSANKLATFDHKTQLTAGIKAISTSGHTAGHSVYEVESQGQKLWLIGDLIHVTAVQLDHPEVTIAFDSDQKKAAEQRDKIFTQAAKQGVLVGAAHIQFPGLGHLRKEGKAYEWIPVNFTQLH